MATEEHELVKGTENKDREKRERRPLQILSMGSACPRASLSDNKWVVSGRTACKQSKTEAIEKETEEREREKNRYKSTILLFFCVYLCKRAVHVLAHITQVFAIHQSCTEHDCLSVSRFLLAADSLD